MERPPGQATQSQGRLTTRFPKYGARKSTLDGCGEMARTVQLDLEPYGQRSEGPGQLGSKIPERKCLVAGRGQLVGVYSASCENVAIATCGLR